MRSIQFSRRLEETSCGVRGELLNRGSRVRVPPPAPFLLSQMVEAPRRRLHTSDCRTYEQMPGGLEVSPWSFCQVFAVPAVPVPCESS